MNKINTVQLRSVPVMVPDEVLKHFDPKTIVNKLTADSAVCNIMAAPAGVITNFRFSPVTNKIVCDITASHVGVVALETSDIDWVLHANLRVTHGPTQLTLDTLDSQCQLQF